MSKSGEMYIIFQRGISCCNWHGVEKQNCRQVFVFGDCAFLTSLYGLSGFGGMHFCLWCLVNKNDMQIPTADRGEDNQVNYIKKIVHNCKQF